MRAFEAFAIAIEACRENAAQPGELGPQQLAHETVERVLARYDEGEDSANEDLVALLRLFLKMYCVAILILLCQQLLQSFKRTFKADQFNL